MGLTVEYYIESHGPIAGRNKYMEAQKEVEQTEGLEGNQTAKTTVTLAQRFFDCIHYAKSCVKDLAQAQISLFTEQKKSSAD